MIINAKKIVLGISLFGILNIKSGCSIKPSAERAGKEFCHCVEKNSSNLKRKALDYCREKISERYRFLKIYLDTRGNIIDTIYESGTIDSMMNFVGNFARTVDDCNPPYWFESDKFNE